jgi:hypothetical protein
MSDKPDWEAIQREYEGGGVSLRLLAAKYGVSKSVIGDRKFREQWKEPAKPDGRTADKKNPDTGQQNIFRLMPAPSPASAVALATMGLEDLLGLMQKSKGSMDFADHVKASSAMAQYNKIIINALPDEEEQEEEQEDLSGFSEDELRQYAEYQERAKKRA